MPEKNAPETGTALLEIGTEELPARFFYEALPRMESLAAKLLEKNRLACEKISVFGTPRRLVLEIRGLSMRQPDCSKEIRGPAKTAAYDDNGEPTSALRGFLKGQNTDLSLVKIKDFSGKPHIVVQMEEKGKETLEVLSGIFPEIIYGISFPKSMRWNGNFLFGRPIRWLLALLENRIVPFELAALKSGADTFGHRLYSKGPVKISHPRDYLPTLQKKGVVAHHARRSEMIRRQAQKLARSKPGSLYRLDSILEEVTLLVEYPTAFPGNFEERFLTLPAEVLITVMRHQRYFPVLDKNQNLLPFFVAVRNGKKQGLDEVRAGNERVIRARFKDAQYFFESDRKTKLGDRFEALDKLTFQKNLGTVKQKVERIEALCDWLARECHLPAAFEKNNLRTAARLCKCDLAAQMIFEFPELQGVMGKEYARLEGYPEDISQAILDHYLPRFAGDIFPKTFIGTLLAVADRLDTLAGCFGLNLKPSGSSDPLGLRRAGATLLQILLEKRLEVDLKRAAAQAFREFTARGMLGSANAQAVLSDLETFLLERAETVWKSAGVRYDLIRANGRTLLEKPNHCLERALFLEKLRVNRKDEFVSFVTAWIRIFNILKSKEAQETVRTFRDPAPPTLAESAQEEEKNLAQAYPTGGTEAAAAFSAKDFEKGWKILSDFQNPINLFFDKVLVMAQEPETRRARINLLWHLQNLMLDSFGDLTQIVLD